MITRHADTIGAVVRRLLQERGMSQRDLADAVGSTSSTISNLVNGVCPGLEWPLVVAIANHFGVSIDLLASAVPVQDGKSLYRELCER